MIKAELKGQLKVQTHIYPMDFFIPKYTDGGILCYRLWQKTNWQYTLAVNHFSQVVTLSDFTVNNCVEVQQIILH